MIDVVAKLDMKAVGTPSRLVMDYLAAGRQGLPPHLGPFLLDESAWRARCDAVRQHSGSGDRSTWHAVVDEIAELSRRLGTSDSVLGKLAGARDRETFFVMTGQQPGVLAGPLHTIYKVVTAIALATRLERMLGITCVPLYWCGADDVDFAEVREIHLLTQGLSPISTAIAQDAHAGGMPVGDIDSGALRALWKGLEPFVDEFPCGNAVSEGVREAFECARDHGELCAATLVSLAAGRVAVVDGRSAAVRRHVSHIFRAYVESEDEVKQVVVDSGKRLETAGYHAQLAVGKDSGVFLLEDGRRKSVSAEQRGTLLAALTEDAARCSPGVVARSLVQDECFKPLAVVLGAAEVAYKAQIAPLYKRFGVLAPVNLPRLGATFLPPPLCEVIECGRSESVRGLVENPGAFAKTVFETSVPAAVATAARELQVRGNEIVAEFIDAVGEEVPQKVRGRILSRAGEVRGRIDAVLGAVRESGRASALARWPFLSDLDQVVQPSGRLQERSLSGLLPFLFAGDKARAGLIDLASLYVDELMDDRARHIVYSCQS